MKSYLSILLALAIATAARAQTPGNCRKCFPMKAQMHYRLPVPDDALVKDAAVRTAFKTWERAYLRTDDGALYVRNDEKNQNGTTTSEAIGYGMLIEVLMAEKGDSSQVRFDQLYRYARRYHATSSPYLMGWKQFKRHRRDNKDTATDGDLDIAFALLLAHEQWDDPSTPAYLNDALRTIEAIKRNEIDTADLLILRGDHGLFEYQGKVVKVTRTSDLMPDHFRAFAYYTHDALWTQLISANYRRFKHLQDTSDTYHLFSDYTALRNGELALLTFLPRRLAKQEDLKDGGDKKNLFGNQYGQNACRVPWRLAADHLTSGDTTARRLLEKLNAGAKLYSGNDPCRLTNVMRTRDDPAPEVHRRQVDEDLKDDSAGDQLLAPLSLAALTAGDKDWRERLTALFMDQKNCYPRGPKSYFENTIHLLSLILYSGNYWTPTTTLTERP